MTTYTTKFGASQIDRAAGLIKGVCLISSKTGVAAGHNLHIDSKTLQSFLTACQSKKTLRCKLDHQNSAASFVGTLSNFRLDGDSLRADLQLLQSSEHRNYVLEIADRMPKEFGLSVEFVPTTQTIGGKDFVRCESISGAAIVSDPAATSGLFSDGGLAATNVSTVVPAQVVPSGHKRKGAVQIQCPQCAETTQFLSRLAAFHDNAADRLDKLCESLEPKDNVSSVPTEQQFQARLEAQRVELTEKFEKQANVLACRLLAKTGIKLSRLPEPQPTEGVGILAALDGITDDTERSRFYQKNKSAIQAAFTRLGAVSLSNCRTG